MAVVAVVVVVVVVDQHPPTATVTATDVVLLDELIDSVKEEPSRQLDDDGCPPIIISLVSAGISYLRPLQTV